MELVKKQTSRGGWVRILSGVDDGSAFHVQVPMRCHTVEEAVQWLRPPEVPDGSLRQGEFFFIPVASIPAEGIMDTPTVSYVYLHRRNDAEFSSSHQAEECVVIWKTGRTRFFGRRGGGHDWVGRPRYYVRGNVTHPEHTTLSLGLRWHEVIPNRAHGKFPVRGFGNED